MTVRAAICCYTIYATLATVANDLAILSLESCWGSAGSQSNVIPLNSSEVTMQSLAICFRWEGPMHSMSNIVSREKHKHRLEGPDWHVCPWQLNSQAHLQPQQHSMSEKSQVDETLVMLAGHRRRTLRDLFIINWIHHHGFQLPE